MAGKISSWLFFIFLVLNFLFAQNPEWVVYNTSNSGLPDNFVRSIAVDPQGNKWIGTLEGGLAKFDGANWTVYNRSNSGLPSDSIEIIAIDGLGNTWIGTEGRGLAKFDGTNWTVYNTSNSGLPSYYVRAIAIDSYGNNWFGTVVGLAKFDGLNWTVYNRSNSGLPDDYVRAIAIDSYGNKWIGTDVGGVAVYREGGVLDVYEKEEKIIPRKFSLYQNYPNPFNPETVIEFDIPEVSNVKLEVYDVLGRKVKTILDDRLEVGRYRVRFDGGDLPSGVYFYSLITNKFSSVKKMVLVK